MALTKAQMRLFLYGQAGGSVRAKASPRQWRRLQRVAKKRGTTIDGLTSGIPTALQPRTRRAITAEARRTIMSAYHPAFRQLDAQVEQARNLDAKRAADFQHYQDWVANKQRDLQQASQSYGDMVASHQDRLRQDIAGMFASASQGADGQAQQVYQDALAPAAAQAGELITSQQQLTDAARADASAGLAATNSNNLAALSADERRRQADVAQQLQDLMNSRLKLAGDRSADIQREMARLRDQEISKANANRDYQTAAAELGIKQQSLALDQARTKFDQQFKLSQEQRRRMEANRSYQLDLAQFGHDKAQDRYMREHGLGRYKTSSRAGGSAGIRPLTMSQQNKIFGDIDRATLVAARVAANRGISGEQLVVRLMQGGKTFPALDRVTAQAAADLVTGNRKLSRRAVQLLHKAGVKLGDRYAYIRKDEVAGPRVK